MNITIGPIKNKATWRAVVRKAQAMGYEWHAGEDGLVDEGWEESKEDSVIILGKVSVHIYPEDNDISYGSKERAKELGFNIITPDKYLFGVDPGDKLRYHGEEVEYFGYELKGTDVIIKIDYSWYKWSETDKERKKGQMTNIPEIGTRFHWVSWKDLEPVEENNWTQKAKKAIEEDKRIVEIRTEASTYPFCWVASPEEYYNYYKNLTYSDEQNKSEDKTMLQELTNALKKHLPGDIKKQYKAGFRNGDLELTQKGIEVLIEEILADKYNDELTEKAEEIIKEHEEEE